MQRKQSTDRLLTMGLALYADKRTMEQRVRGIFGRKRTAAFARALSAILALLVCVGGFTTACLPVRGEVVTTHENELALVPVTHASAAGEPMPESVQAEAASPLAETLGVPQPWRFDQTSADGLLRVTGNIAVTLPNAAAVPIATADCREVTEVDLQRVANAFFGADASYTYAVQDTKEYAEAYLIKNKALYESVLDGTCENRVPSYHKSVVQQYEAYKKLAETAPPASERRPLAPTFTEHMSVTGDTYPGFRGVAEKDGVDYLVSAANLERASAVNIREVYEDYSLSYMNSFRTEPEGVSVTKEEAVAQATAMAAKVDDGLALCHVMPAGTFAADSDDKVSRWAWQCVFMRTVNGVGTVYDSRDVGSDISSEVYGRVNETLEITVDDRGVCNVHWINPMTVTGVSNATPLPFSAITDALIEQLRAKYDYEITRENGTRALYLWRAELGLMRIGKPGAKSYTLEPVWSFFIDFDETPDYSDPDLQRPAYDGDPAYGNSLTVSAIDGRLIDRDRGY